METAKINPLNTKISTDTRTIKDGDFYLPLVGENFDGHDYIAAALAKGAVGSFCQENKWAKLKDKQNLEEEKIILVKDTLKEYHRLANEYRKQVNPLVIGITGSSGKTTCKEMLRAVLSKFTDKLHYSHANFNNEIGVPKTILEMPQDTEILILEMGMRGLGEIELLSKTAEPNISLITNIGVAHIERLGSKANIEKAKLEICKGLNSYKPKPGNDSKHSILNGILEDLLVIDKNLYSKLRKEKRLEAEGSEKRASIIKDFDSTVNYKIRGLAGNAIYTDANAIAAIAKYLGMTDKQIQEGLDLYQPLSGRGTFHYDTQGNLFIDDSYNANPDSARQSIEAMLGQFPEENKIIVLGEMLESDPKLIEEFYQDLEKKITECIEDSLTLVKADGKDIQEINEELSGLLNSLKENGKKNAILIKGSRKAGLERLLDFYNLTDTQK